MKYIERIYNQKENFIYIHQREPLYIKMGVDSYQLLTRNLILPFGMKDFETVLGMQLKLVKMNRRPYLITIGHVYREEEFYLD